MTGDGSLLKAGFVHATQLKSYLYQSRAKIDGLYQQIQGPKKKTTLEWKVDLKFLLVSRKTETEQEPNDETKLNAVLRELELLKQIGGVEEGKPYIKGIFPMRWGIYNDSQMRPDNEGPLVYFSGMADGMLIGLGGSSHHIVGCYGLTSTASRSSTPALVHFLRTGLETGEAPPPYWRDRREELDEVYQAMAIANHYLREPTQDLEFVARVLCRGDAAGGGSARKEQVEAILATPLYVAQVHAMEEDD